MRRGAIVVAGVALALALGPGAAQAEHQPGLYEITTIMNMPGGPPPAPRVSTRCVTPDEARDPSIGLSQSMQRASQCNVTRKDMSGSHFVADMVCTGDQQVRSHFDLIFGDTSAHGTVTMVMQSPQRPQPMTVTLNMTSVRKGACP